MLKLVRSSLTSQETSPNEVTLFFTRAVASCQLGKLISLPHPHPPPPLLHAAPHHHPEGDNATTTPKTHKLGMLLRFLVWKYQPQREMSELDSVNSLESTIQTNITLHKQACQMRMLLNTSKI